ncbi:MAG: transposase [Oceanospirillaceae bacterium]|nr:transposase [Oceanospirillaceae bacterium]
MTRARAQQICCQDTPYYHCISRVVRKAFLCGFDKSTQQDFEHRRQWMLDRLGEINAVFCIDICAYAIMSNHYHLVLYINKDEVDALTDEEVIERWRKIYTGPDIIQRFVDGEKLTKEHYELIAEIVAMWRNRLEDISWFMRTLNEYVARKANFEDNCTGHFWEGRFKSQALLDEQALLTCMAYVELNPIRAKMAETPEYSDFTSIKQRIEDDQQIVEKPNDKGAYETQAKLLLKKFWAEGRQLEDEIPYHYREYLELVDWSGRAIREDKRGAIDAHIPPILLRLGIDTDQWHKAMQPKGAHQFSRAMGRCDALREHAKRLSIKWIKGITLSCKLFPT